MTCEIEKDRDWVGQYECATHGVSYRDSDKKPKELCPVGEVESELREAIKRGDWLQGELTAAKGEVVGLKYGHTWEQERAAVVAWLMDLERKEWSQYFGDCIEEGLHWPNGEGK